MEDTPIIPWTPFIPHRPHPKQLAFLLLPQLEALYGGAAGGGKSDCLLMAALQYVDIQRYSAIIFRRTLSDLKQEDALINRAMSWLGGWHPYVRYIPERHAFIFPSGAALAFGYIGDYGNLDRYQGAAYQFCLEVSEKIRMADGSLKPIGSIRTGDQVLTLEGPRRVTYVSPRLKKKCVRLSGPQGSQIQSEDHRILTDRGWVSYAASKSSIQYRESHNIYGYAKELFSKSEKPLASSLAGHEPASLRGLQTHLETFRQDRDASSANDQSDYAKFDGSHQAIQQLLKSSYQSEPSSLVFRSTECDRCSSDRFCGNRDVWFCQLEPDYQYYCLHDYDSCGEQSLGWSNISQVCLPLSNDAVGSSQPHLLRGALVSIPTHSHTDSIEYAHPYTMEARSSSYAYGFSPCSWTPVGIREVVDIRVESANHYISSSNFVNSNCGFDELTQHNEEDYLYLFSRLRRSQCELHAGHVEDGEAAPLPDDPNCRTCAEFAPLKNVPLRMRSTCNPGGIGHVWVKERFHIDMDPVTGRWVGMEKDRPFMPSRVEDNPSLPLKEYNESLQRLDPLTREQLRYGNWGAVANARFKKDWLCYYERSGDRITMSLRHGGVRELHYHGLQVFAVIDPAASVKEGIADIRFHKRVGRSYSVIGVFGVTQRGDLLWLDMDAMQTESPEMLQRVRTMTRLWKPSFIICEAIGVGLPIFQMLQSMGLPVRPLTNVPDKIANAVEAQVRMEQGKVYFPRYAPWRKALDDVLFAWTGHPHEINDHIDVLSNACHQVTRLAGEDQFDPYCGSAPMPMAYETSFSMPL